MGVVTVPSPLIIGREAVREIVRGTSRLIHREVREDQVMSRTPVRPLRRMLAPLVVTLALLTTATIASAAPSQPTAAQPQVGVAATAAPGSLLDQWKDAGEVAASSESGGCWVTLAVSSCMGVVGTLAADFYVHTLSGTPEGTRYDVLVVSEHGELWVVAKGILNHTGHYGGWPVNTTSRAYTAVVISDPSGGTVYYIASSPWAKK